MQNFRVNTIMIFWGVDFFEMFQFDQFFLESYIYIVLDDLFSFFLGKDEPPLLFVEKCTHSQSCGTMIGERRWAAARLAVRRNRVRAGIYVHSSSHT